MGGRTGAMISSAPGILTIGFGSTVAMWLVGYVGRLPVLLLPSPLLLFLMLGCLFIGGAILGRLAAGSWCLGALAGFVSGTLNLLVLGSLLAGGQPNRLIPSALWWIPGSVLVSALLGSAGAGMGSRYLDFIRPLAVEAWPAAFSRVAIAATLLLLAVGGLVTSNEAGLAVVDWPNSFGYNMFLYPFSRMTGPVYYEHAHRLFGALVGLTTLVLAGLLWKLDPRSWVRRLGFAALAMVMVQGILGGLRVTGRLTLSQSPELMAPSLILAVAHGALAQLFFGTMVALGAFTSAGWRCERLHGTHPARADRRMVTILVGLLVCQLVLGAVQRHLQALLVAHIVVGVALVAPLALHVGVRAWALNPETPVLRRLGLALVGSIGVQIALGVGAYAMTGRGVTGQEVPSTLEITLTTAHQWFGAVTFALAVLVACWSFRPCSADPAPRAC